MRKSVVKDTANDFFVLGLGGITDERELEMLCAGINTLSNLAVEDECRWKICNAEIIPTLISLLHSPHQQTRESTRSLLWSISLNPSCAQFMATMNAPKCFTNSSVLNSEESVQWSEFSQG